METLIEFKKAHFSYRSRKSFFRHHYYHALKGIDLQINRGETLGVIGRNGAGKSTLLKLIGGILTPSKGIVKNNNAVVTLLSLQAGFDPELTGIENITLTGMLLGYEKEFIQSRYNAIKEFSELKSNIYKPIKSYSTGMRARLGFSLATQLKPDIILLDEIMGVGDREFRIKSSKYMKDIVKTANQTAVLVNHNPKDILELCNRAIWIDNGIIKSEGKASVVMQDYERSLPINKD